MIHSQTVPPPLAAIEGRTFKLNTATTNSNTRSHRPSTRRKCGCSDVTSLLKKLLLRKFRVGFCRARFRGGAASRVVLCPSVLPHQQKPCRAIPALSPALAPLLQKPPDASQYPPSCAA